MSPLPIEGGSKAADINPGLADIKGEPLTLGLRPEIERLLAGVRDGLSEYCFAHLFLFRNQRFYRYQSGDLPCIAGVNTDGDRFLLPLFDPARVSSDCLWARLRGYDCYFPVGQRRAANFNRQHFVAEADAADSDYIFPVGNFLDYEGPELDAKRKGLGQLLQRSRPVAVPFGRGSAAGARAILDAWTAAHPDPVAQTDYAPCLEAIEQAEELGLQGHVYYAEEVPIGFVLGETIADNMLALHFVKAQPEVPCAFDLMFHHVATAQAKRVRWFNFEQDYGLARLRQAKLAYEPSMLLQKFRVRMALRARWPIESEEASS
jgi:hypothetical protein